MRTGEKPRILVVDDERVSLDSLSELLGDAGYDVRTAKDGASALATVRDFAPDLVISDLSMPHLGGYGLLQCIREGTQTRVSSESVRSARNPSPCCWQT